MSAFSDEVGVIRWDLSEHETREELEGAESGLELSLSIIRGYLRGVREKIANLPEEDSRCLNQHSRS
jgi:hypothetical protein